MVAAERTAVRLVCAECGTEYPIGVPRYRCDCGGLLNVEQPLEALRGVVSRALFDGRLASRARIDQSGVWRFRELLGDYAHNLIVTKPEGRGNLYDDPRLTAWAGVGALCFKHEGENPTGSFKDRGMTVGDHPGRARSARARSPAPPPATPAPRSPPTPRRPACTRSSSSPRARSRSASWRRRSPTARACLQVRGDFDAAMRLVQRVARDASASTCSTRSTPSASKGRRRSCWELLQDARLGAAGLDRRPRRQPRQHRARSARRCARRYAGGWIDAHAAAARRPGARGRTLRPQPSRQASRTRHRMTAETVATAIRIGDPVCYDRARAAIERTAASSPRSPTTRSWRPRRRSTASGIGCEPASAATLAGLRALVAAGRLPADCSVLAILTGHLMKDAEAVAAYHQPDPHGERPGANPPITIDPTLDAVKALLDGASAA